MLLPPRIHGVTDGVRTRDTWSHNAVEHAAPREDAPNSAHLASEYPRASAAVSATLPRSAAASEPTDAELERGILDAVRLGLGDVARTLSGQLEARRAARLPKNVTPIEAAKRRER